VYVLVRLVKLNAFTDAVPESTFVAERSRLLRLPKLTTIIPGACCASKRVRVLWSVPDIFCTTVCWFETEMTAESYRQPYVSFVLDA
jgi:hypothetical protein